MIREFYVFKRSGNPVFHKSYGEKRVDEALLSGFLAAVFSFAREIGHGEIQSMVMKDTVFVYEVAGDLIFAVAVDLDDDEETARGFLSQAISLFPDSYKDELNERVIDSFGKNLEPLISKYNSRLMVKDVFCAPFLISGDESNDEISLAMVFLMLERMKSQRIGLLKRRKVYVRSVAKILWPFWIVPAEVRGCVIVDGLFRDPIIIKCFSPPDLKEEELEMSSVKDPLKAIDRIARNLKEKGTYETFSIPSLVGHEHAQELVKFFAYARTSKVKDATILSPIVDEVEVNNVKEKFLNVFKAVRENAERLKALSEKVVKIAETHIKWLEEEESRIEKEYLERIKRLEQEIDEERRRAEEEKSQIKKEVGEWACQVASKEVESVKEHVASLSSSIMNVADFISNALKPSEREEIDKLGSLEELVSLLERLKSEMKVVDEDVRHAERAVRSVISEAQKRYQSVEQQIEKKISDMEKKVNDVRREMEARLSSISKVKEKYREKLKDIYSYLERHLKTHEADIATLTGSMINGFNPERPSLVYMTTYVAELNENGDTQIILISPVSLIKKPEEKKIDDVVEKSMASFLKKRFEEHLREHWFAEEVKKALAEINLLKQKELEPKVYDGLSSLLKEGYITKKEFSMIKMNVIEFFREKTK